MTKEVESLYNILEVLLNQNCPILSGNMKAHIKVVNVGDNEVTFELSAPFYDLKEFKKSGAIVYTGSPKKYGGVTDYAEWVNSIGAFGRHNKSEHWVNRTCFQAAVDLANHIGAIVKNTLPLD